MLTKSDLKAIENIFDLKLEEKLESKLEEKLESKLNIKLKPINNRLDRIEKKLDKAIDTFDRHELEIVKNVKVIQRHLDIPVMEFA